MRYKAGFLAISIAALAAMSFAVEIEWSGGTGDWATGSNWIGGSAPSTGDGALIKTGTATITGTHSVTQGVFGSGSGAVGTVIVNGGSLASSGVVHLGATTNSQGILTVNNGGTVDLTKTLYVAYNIGSGELNINGSGSRVTINAGTGNTLTVGRNNGTTGTVSITGGGLLTTSGTVYLGNTANATGSVLIDGQNSVWKSLGGTFYVGNTGTGTLTIQNGGFVSVAGTITNGAKGSIQIGIDGALAIADGGSTATNLDEFYGLFVTGSAKNITYWNGAGWDDISNAVLGTDYTLTSYSDGGKDYTKLTVIPEPVTSAFWVIASAAFLVYRRLSI
ncbi:MAG: hypothetical protein WC959_08790 [Kiritimatiellales bacterium]